MGTIALLSLLFLAATVVTIRKEKPFAGPGEHSMEYVGSAYFPNRYGGESLRHSFENQTHQATIITNKRMTLGSRLDNLIEKMAGRKIAEDELYDIGSLVGRVYRITVSDIHGLPRAVDAEPVTDAEGTQS